MVDSVINKAMGLNRDTLRMASLTSVHVLHDVESRSNTIPLSHNITPGCENNAFIA